MAKLELSLRLIGFGSGASPKTIIRDWRVVHNCSAAYSGIEMAISRPTPPRTQQLASKCCKTAACGAVRSVYGRSGQQVRTMRLRSLVLATALVSVSLPALARGEL